ncbi:hypothetical protein JXR93_14005 [bacterium]|nr:hypothetical protein [bacterium]
MRKFLVWLFTGATSILMSACYGPVHKYHMRPINVNIVDSSNQAITGITITAYCNNNSNYSANSDGSIIIPTTERSYQECKIEAKDLNNQYKTTSIDMKNGEHNYTIVLEKN